MPLAVAAPLAFLAGIIVGLGLSSSFAIVRKRDLPPQYSRNYSGERGDHENTAKME